jgi:hypothetical protein
VGTYPEQAQFEHLEQPTGTGADDDHFGLDALRHDNSSSTHLETG